MLSDRSERVRALDSRPAGTPTGHGGRAKAGGLIGLALGLLVSLSAPPAAHGQDTIRIGVFGPHTGAASRWGTFGWRGATLASRQINATGGVLGKKLELFQGDSQCVPAEGVSAVQRMINRDNVQMLIGDICSSVTLAVQPVAEEAKLVLMNAASSNPDITYKAGAGGFKWTFRNYPTDEVRALVVLEYVARQRNMSKFAALAVDSDFGRGAIAFSKKYLPRFKGQLLSEDYYKDKETDFRPVLTKIKAAGAQAIIFYGLVDSVPIIGRQMRELGLAGKVFLIGGGELSHPDTVKAATPEVMNGAVEATAWLPEWEHPRSKQFIEDYRKLYAGELPNLHAYTHWETLHLLTAALKKANSVKSDDLHRALKGLSYDGAMGKVVFDDHNQAEVPMVLVEVVNGKAVQKGAFTTKVDYPKR